MDLSGAVTLKSSDHLIGIEENFKLCAGPGAGKTRFLVNHIKNIVSNSDRLKKTRKIACITYTNIGVETLANRLENSLDYVEISTIHSFLYKNVIKPYLWLLQGKYKINISEIDGHDDFLPRISILIKWLKKTNQNHIRDYDQLQKDMRKIILCYENNETQWKLKHPYESKVRFENIIDYKKMCWQKGLLTHNDVLFLSYQIIKKSEEVQEILRAKFPYVFIDEFQDTTPVQSEIIKIIAQKESVVGVIGDTAQSIYGFLGSSVESFIDFNLEDMILYKLENNHRSTEEIINILNKIRDDQDFTQKSPDKISGALPKIIIGDFNSAYQYVKNLFEEEFYTLSYKNKVTNMMRFELDDYLESIDLEDLLTEDSNNKRRTLLINIIKAIEFARDKNYKDSIKFMMKAYRKSKDFSEQNAIKNLQRLLNHYDDYKNITLKKFHNKYLYDFFNTSNISSKIGSSGGPHELYSGFSYDKIALTVKLNSDNSFYRTIHKAKGDEFENLLLIVPSDEKDSFMKFLNNSNLTEKESHRRYYVALSRAKKRLFVNLSEISEEEKENLIDFGFDVKKDFDD